MTEIKREPYLPATRKAWRDTVDMLCGHCARFSDCQVIEGMIEMKHGEPWPEGGWVTDPGAGATCLSYQPQERETLSRQRMRQAIRKAIPMCDGCAARKGSEASVSLHTRRDFAEAVRNRSQFNCHQAENRGKPCGGWCNAIKGPAKGDRQ